jgi:hypothetical protein
VFLDMEELRDVGATVDEVARFLLDLRQADAGDYGATVIDPNGPVFDAVIPRESFGTLSCVVALTGG